ncbi:phosphoribosylanthranilate isomerase [Luminiphilus sp.]|nr:phosphoribosylanthranilate isomerase [Luminiphilus sp.]MDA9722218.1 phosphoribosylanthranilate isomerase [Luminiphilus sp.]
MRIKICGITRPGDAEQALALGADTIGCVFHAESARHVTAEIALDIQIAVGNAGTLVGLFVDPTVDEVHAVLDRIDLDVLQFHGQESPAFCEQFQRPYLKAVAMSADVDLSAVNKAYESARGLLLDSAHEGQFGGTGQRFDWDWIDAGLENRLMLAGGLSADNVGEAIRQVRPTAVDVSSGVERDKGIKDSDRMRAFIEAALPEMSEGEL